MRKHAPHSAVRLTSSLVAASLLAVGAASGIAQESPVPSAPPAAEARPAPSAGQLQSWIRDLSADEFLARDTAMLNLIDAGQPAITAIRGSLAGQGLEATSRALYVLEQLGLASDFDVQEEARAALADLAARKETPQLARRAAGVLAVLTERRSAQALAELQTLGARVVLGQDFNGFFAEEYVASIEIDADFRGDEQDLRRLKWLSDVRMLVLAGPQANDGWLKQAAAMDGLSELHVYQAAISPAGFASFAGSTSLTTVGVYYCKVDDETLDHLQKLPALNFVKLYGTPIGREAVEKFQAATGLAKVDHRKGAFLGVGCENIEGLCLIATVHEESPAKRAGLLPDDQVVRFGDDPVTDFDSLTALISQRGVEDAVEMEVKRHTLDDEGNMALKSVTVRVKLGPWDMAPAVRNAMRP